MDDLEYVDDNGKPAVAPVNLDGFNLKNKSYQMFFDDPKDQKEGKPDPNAAASTEQKPKRKADKEKTVAPEEKPKAPEPNRPELGAPTDKKSDGSTKGKKKGEKGGKRDKSPASPSPQPTNKTKRCNIF